MHGGTTRDDPEYPGILSIPDTVSVRGYVGRDNMGSVPGYLVFRILCVVHLHVRQAWDRAMVLLHVHIPGSPAAPHDIPDQLDFISN